MMMKNKIIIPLIVGVFLGFISVLVSRVPAPVAAWSGMRVLANHVGYLAGALLIAYINSDKWLKSFITSAFMLTAANLVYYLLIHLGGVFGLFPAHSFLTELADLAIWTVIAVICAALSATAIMFMLHGKTKSLRIQAGIAWYFAMLGVIYIFNYHPVTVRYNCKYWRMQNYLTDHTSGRNFTSDIFEIAFAFALVTIILILLLIKIKKGEKKNGENS
jgi:hypothetical protein